MYNIFKFILFYYMDIGSVYTISYPKFALDLGIFIYECTFNEKGLLGLH